VIKLAYGIQMRKTIVTHGVHITNLIPKQTIINSDDLNYQFMHKTPKGNFYFSNLNDNIDFKCSIPGKGNIIMYDDRDKSKFTVYKSFNKVVDDALGKKSWREISDNNLTTREHRILDTTEYSNIIKRKFEFNPATMRYQYYSDGSINICRREGFGFIAHFYKPQVFDPNGNELTVDSHKIVKENGEMFIQTVINPIDFAAHPWVLLDPDFSISITSDFDAGTKSSSDGNYDCETETDNPTITSGQLELGNCKGDAFNLSDGDANNFKWDPLYVPGFGNVGGSADINITSSGKLYVAITGVPSNTWYTIRSRSAFVDTDYDFTVEVDWDYNPSFVSRQALRLIFYDGAWNAFGYINREYNSGHIIVAGVSGGGATQIGSSATSGKFKIEYTQSTNNWEMFYDVGGGWVSLHSEASDPGDQNVYVNLSIFTLEGGLPNTNGNYDNFNFTKITTIGTVYRNSFTWESETQTITAGKKLLNTTIGTSGLTVIYKITQIDWLVGGDVKATYATDIESGTTLLIEEDDLTSGTFENVDDDFTIRVTGEGDGAGSFALNRIDGNYTSAAGVSILGKVIMIKGNQGPS
jgi:hypothetical protein